MTMTSLKMDMKNKRDMRGTGTLHDLVIHSRLLRGNPMGNPWKRRLLVYTPPGFTKGEGLPCVIFLPGFGSRPEHWLELDFPAHRLMDLLTLSGEVPRALLVCVDGSTRLGGSQYIDSSLNGPFMRHLVEEIVPFLRGHFGVAEKMAICGHSSGGFGALSTASLHPDIFPRVASFAGDMHFELTHKNMLAKLVNDVRSGALPAGLAACLAQDKTHYELALCAAYSPNLRRKTWKADFPVDVRSGEMVDQVWERWMSFDPLSWVHTRRGALRRLEKIFLSCGDRDQFALHIGADAFAFRCRKEGVAVENRTHAGDHGLLARQLEAGLKAMLRDR